MERYEKEIDSLGTAIAKEDQKKLLIAIAEGVSKLLFDAYYNLIAERTADLKNDKA